VETAQYLFREETIPGNLKIELTNGSHNWPDSEMLANTWGFLSFTGKAGDVSSRNKSPFTAYCRHQQDGINLLRHQGDFLKATLLARNMALTEPFNSDKAFPGIYNVLKVHSGYISQLNRLGKCLNNEISVRQPSMDAFRTKDTLWWKNEIGATNEKIRTEKDSYTRDMYLRIKGFWGIANYTLCKQAVQEQNAETLNKLLSIYRMLEPENPDMFYFSSFPYYWKGNNEATLSLLKKAMKAGFSDRSQLKRDFPQSITSKLY